MKWFLIFLAISLTASEKLDRTYLPPPGAQFAGGNSGDIQAPFETPNISQLVNIPVVPTVIGLNEFGTTGQPTQTTPITTTSYAFTQTTTYPSVESYETTINPVTGLPVLDQNGQQQYGINLPGFIQSQIPGIPGYGTNVQPGSPNQLPNQIITPEGLIQIPDSISPGLDQSYVQHGKPETQVVNQNPGQNAISTGIPYVIPGSTTLVPSSNQGVLPYPSETNTPKDKFSETAFPGVAPGQISQGIYSKQPIIVPDTRLPQYNLDYQNKGRPISQQSFEDYDKVGPAPINEQSIFNPAHHHDGITNITPGFPSTTAAHASITDDINNRPERPQTAADRNAVIINYENVRTPNGYSYSYDTSNGIHADETGTVGDGTKAQGSYSYIGDDGKVYSVTYTADENGFQPHGDHLPTPPPIPEAIQKVIDQAARDEAAGIIDDGSYDEVKYGHDQYQRPMTHRHPQIKDRNLMDNNNILQAQRKIVRPITGISDDVYYETEQQDNLSSDITDKTLNSDGNRKNINNEDNLLFTGQYDIEKNNLGMKQQEAFSRDGYLPTRQPISPTMEKNVPQIGMDYSGLQIEDIKESDIYPDNVEGFISENDKTFDSFEHPRSDHGSYSQDNSFLPISNRRPNTKQRPIGRPPGTSNNKYTKDKKPQSDQNFDHGNSVDFGEIRKGDSLPSDQNNIQQVNDNGYHYNSPQDQFPTRFSAEENYSTTRPLDKRPYVTPDVHNQPSDVRLNGNRQNYNTQPFMTSSVISPKEGAYTDYDDGDYNIGQDENSSIKKPSGQVDVGTRRRIQPTYATSSPQYNPSGQRIRVDQDKRVLPGQKIDYSRTPSYTQSSTTPTPPHNAVKGSTEIHQNPGFSTTLTEPDFETSGLYQTKPEPRPVPSHGSRIPTGQRGSTLQSYPTAFTTIKPVAKPDGGYFYTTSTPASVPSYGSRIPSGQKVTTVIPITDKYQPTLGSLNPSRTPDPIQQPTGTNLRNRYQYTTTAKPQIPEKSDTKTFFPGVSTRTYPTTSAPIKYSVTSSRPSTPDKQGVYGPGTTESLPVDAYQAGYQYEPPNIGSNDVSLINTGPLGSTVSHTSPSYYKYVTPGSVYSTTVSPSTIGTTPASLIPSSTPGRPTQTYSTTQRPGYASTQNIYDQTPLVDGFGRPIPSGHAVNQRPGIFITGGEDIRTPDELSTGPISKGGIPIGNIGSVNDMEPSKYPGYYDQPKVIGEDFSGPKQPQRFDPQTGYHY